MDAKKSNKIRDIVRLQQILKKWRKTANASKNNHTNNNNNNNNSNHSIVRSNSSSINGGGNKGIKFLKKTLSFSDHSVSSSPTTTTTTEHVPKGYLAVCVGKQFKRYVIPTEYLGHQAFGILLREAEEEFGFHQEGVLKIPCDVAVFERILKMVQNNRDDDHDNGGFYIHDNSMGGVGSFEFHDIDVMSSSCCSPDSEHILQPSIPQLCR